MKKIVLAYSGGLDTSVAIKWLVNKGYSVIAYLADVGQAKDFSKAVVRAKKAGAGKVVVEDLKKEFVTDFIFPALKGNAIYQSKYFLATALSRPLIAKGLVGAAKKEKASFVAHGSTGKGNDQVRFEVSVGALDSGLKTIAPVREWELTSRDQEIRYAKLHGIPVEVTTAKPYSIDKNLWGISIESGDLEDPWFEPKESIYEITRAISKTPAKQEYINIYFERGIPKKIDGKSYEPVKLIEKLSQTGGKHGIGRTDLVEDRIVGIKSREIYEAPAASILVEAHRSLENMVLDREMQHFKDMVSLKYARLIYEGLWYTPLKKALDAFIDYTQKNVTGTVKVKCFKGAATVVGRKSEHSLYKKELATYGKGDIFDQSLAKGFIELWGMPYRKQ